MKTLDKATVNELLIAVFADDENKHRETIFFFEKEFRFEDDENVCKLSVYFIIGSDPAQPEYRCLVNGSWEGDYIRGASGLWCHVEHGPTNHSALFGEIIDGWKK